MSSLNGLPVLLMSQLLLTTRVYHSLLQISQLDSLGHLEIREPRERRSALTNPLSCPAFLSSLLDFQDNHLQVTFLFPVTSSQVHFIGVFLYLCTLFPSSYRNSVGKCCWREFLALAHMKQNRRNSVQLPAKGQFQDGVERIFLWFETKWIFCHWKDPMGKPEKI